MANKKVNPQSIFSSRMSVANLYIFPRLVYKVAQSSNLNLKKMQLKFIHILKNINNNIYNSLGKQWSDADTKPLRTAMNNAAGTFSVRPSFGEKNKVVL